MSSLLAFHSLLLSLPFIHELQVFKILVMLTWCWLDTAYYHPYICGDMKVPIYIINFGDEDVHLYPDKKIAKTQEEKLNPKDLQTNNSHESICEVDEGEEAGFFSELAYEDRISEGKVITSPADISP